MPYHQDAASSLPNKALLDALSDAELEALEDKYLHVARTAAADRFSVAWVRISRYVTQQWPSARYLEVNTVDGLDFTPYIDLLDQTGLKIDDQVVKGVEDEGDAMDEFTAKFADTLLDFQKTLDSSYSDIGGGETFPYLDLVSSQPLTPRAFAKLLRAQSPGVH
jgi:hypothetical protein